MSPTTWGAMALLAPLLTAQHPDVPAEEPIDLQAVAVALDPGEWPDVLAMVPPDILARSAAAFAGVSVGGLERALRVSAADSEAQVGAALAILAGAADRDSTVDGLMAEMHACLAIAKASESASFRQAYGLLRDPGWSGAVGPAVRTRVRALGARILREHPESLAAARVLNSILEQPGAAGRARAAIARLGDQVEIADLLTAAAGARARLDLAAAAHWLAAAEPLLARPVTPEDSADRGLLHQARRGLRRLQELPVPDGDGHAAQLARLRLLQVADPDAAVELSRRLIAEEVQDALPHSVLAGDCAIRGQRAAALGHLDRAAALPGREAFYAALVMLVRITPLLAGKDDAEILRTIRSIVQDLDEALASDPSEEARFYFWLRENLAWGDPAASEVAVRDLLPAAAALHREHPDNPQYYCLLLAAIQLTHDHDAARRALLEPLSVALAADPDLAAQRAAAYLAVDLLADRRPVQEELDAVLKDLERSQGHALEASYLRGVRTWWEATRPGADRRLMSEARGWFEAAQRQPGDPGYLRAASALAVARQQLGEPQEFPGWDVCMARDGVDRRFLTHAPRLVLMALSSRDDPGALAEIERASGQLRGPAERVAVASALAAAHHERGAAQEARRLSLRALEALRGSMAPLAQGRGVLRVGQFGSGLAAKRTSAFAQATYRGDLWLLPRLPDEARLGAWAEAR